MLLIEIVHVARFGLFRVSGLLLPLHINEDQVWLNQRFVERLGTATQGLGYTIVPTLLRVPSACIVL